MIRTVLLGRTGNNLFQYALSRVLAEKHGVQLVLDGTWFNDNSWKEVSHFLGLPLKASVRRSPSLPSRALRKFTGKHYWEYLGVPVLREPDSDQSFNPVFLEAPPDCMLFGYFQTPLYFAHMAGKIRAELLGILHVAVYAEERLRERLNSSNSIAVHVRRGDYLNHPIFAVCDRAYYRDSMARMRALLRDARFFIFSDDPAWCRSEFTEPDVEVVDSGAAGADPLHDLHLMSLAQHHIIANSTYSWWAAWLGDKPGQRVIMPERWYAHGIYAPISEKRWKPPIDEDLPD